MVFDASELEGSWLSSVKKDLIHLHSTVKNSHPFSAVNPGDLCAAFSFIRESTQRWRGLIRYYVKVLVKNDQDSAAEQAQDGLAAPCAEQDVVREQCTHCMRQFPSESSLLSHCMRVHGNKKQFRFRILGSVCLCCSTAVPHS